ncbi:hypothetical protein EC396_14365 [Lutibacter sp. HS1-25]|uniref:hypothetical protein n=1 Tax=Lutibacter sp. HS1-25 TaxID=2485000 RepID=UPI00101319D6|nr:hypothetical protein [Lutibacter sp. HS1-25]RXP46190.1 hypothetical protein EC396_14365 [Lutibacter sp. HS1-25]
MLETVLKYLKYGNTFTAIEYGVFNGNNKFQIVSVFKKNNELNIKFKKQFINVEEINATNLKINHFFLVINNEQVLSKIISKETDEVKLLQKAFPSLKISDFYYEIVHLQQNTCVAICRKIDVNKILNDFKKHELDCIGFSLGNGIVTQVIPFVEAQIVATSNANIDVIDGNIQSIDLNPTTKVKSYAINGLNISNLEMLSLSGILAYFTNNNHSLNNFNEIKSKLTKEFTLNNNIQKAWKIGGIVLFSLLLINFFAFDYFNKKVENLTLEKQVNYVNEEKSIGLSQDIERKRRLVEDMINSKSSKTSFYFDQIGTSIFPSIKLTSLDFQPLLKKIENKKPLQLQMNSIIVEGESMDVDYFKNWLNKIENMKWVESVEIIEYGNLVGGAIFILNIQINEQN